MYADGYRGMTRNQQLLVKNFNYLYIWRIYTNGISKLKEDV